MQPLIIGLFWALAVWQMAAAEVDERSPDYSIFRERLRHVDMGQQTPEAELAREKAEASMYTCQVLASVQYTVRCPALAYIYRGLDKAGPATDDGQQEFELNRKIIDGVAYVVTSSDEAKGPLNDADARSFMAAIISLESMPPTSDVVLTLIDLTECLTWSFTDKDTSNQIDKFLHNSARAPILNKIFNHLPIPLRPNRDRVPHFDVNSNDIDKAREFVVSMTGKELAPLVNTVAAEKEVTAPQPPVAEEVEQNSEPAFDHAQLTLLKMLKMQMESKSSNQYDQKVPINCELANKFLKFWTNLKETKLDANNPNDLDAIGFRDDPKNIELEAKVRELLAIYEEMAKLLRELEVKLQTRASGRLLPEVIRAMVERISELFAEIGDSLDVEELREKFEARKLAYTEYSTMDNFVNSPSW